MRIQPHAAQKSFTFAPMQLHFTSMGQGQPLLILHGLLGASDNWQTIGKMLSERFAVYLIDQRNHGRSPHSQEFNYRLLTEDLAEFIAVHKIEKPVLLGHSMGGKTVMNFALSRPATPDKIIVADIMPKEYQPRHQLVFDGLQAIALPALQSRKEADEILSRYVAAAAERQFLLKNLTHGDKGYQWRMNLKSLAENFPAVHEGLVYSGKFSGPSLFAIGAKSDYCLAGDEKIAAQYFPQASWKTFDAGHWVHAEKPTELVQCIMDFAL